MSEVADATVTEQEPIIPAGVESTPPPETEPVAVEASGDGGTAVEDSSIPEELAELARAYQLDPDRWSDKHQLERAITQFDRAYVHALEQATQRFAPQGSPGQAAPEQTTAKPAARTKLELSKLFPNADAYDPEVVNAIKAITEHSESQFDSYEQKLAKLEAIEAELDEYRQERAERQRLDVERQQAEWSTGLDNFFSSLGPEWEDRFGKGPMQKLSPNGPQAVDRNALAKAAVQIRYMDEQNGVKSDIKGQAERALRLAFGHEFPTIERRRLAKQAHERKNGALNRPAAKSGKPGDPDDVVLSRIKEWATKVGEA